MAVLLQGPSENSESNNDLGGGCWGVLKLDRLGQAGVLMVGLPLYCHLCHAMAVSLANQDPVKMCCS